MKRTRHAEWALSGLAALGLCAAGVFTSAGCDDSNEDGGGSGDAARDSGPASDSGSRDAEPPAGDSGRDAAPVDSTPGDLGGALDVGEGDAAPADAAEADAAPPIGGDRPARVYVPTGEAPAAGWPVLVLLHGYQASPIIIENNFPLHRRVDEDGWIVVVPIGRPDDGGALYWEAADRVLDGGAGVDVTYLLGVVEEVVARHGGDPGAVYYVGHSNGGAMAQHMACFAAESVAGFANISGFNPPADRCAPSRPVTSLFAHGTTDNQVPIEGRGERPSAAEAARFWAETVAGCQQRLEPGAPQDLIRVPGAETAATRWADCPASTAHELWPMEGVGHVFIPQPAFFDALRLVLRGGAR